jgi:hypothetical protein
VTAPLAAKPAGTHTLCTTAVCTAGMLPGHCSVTSCGITCCPARTSCVWWVLCMQILRRTQEQLAILAASSA